MAGPPSATRRKRPTGRRTGDSGTRDAVLEAARDLFAEHGFDGASMRAIAARAGVDPALIRHFFGDKAGLFAATMAEGTAIPEKMAAAFEGPAQSRGHRIAEAYLSLWEDAETRLLLIGLVRSAMTSEHGAAMILTVLLGKVQVPGTTLHHDDPIARSFALAGSHLFGLAVARHVLRVPAIAERPLSDLVDDVAPTIQRYLLDVLGERVPGER